MSATEDPKAVSYEDLPRSTQQRYEDELLGRRVRQTLDLLIRMLLLSLGETVGPVIAQAMAERTAGTETRSTEEASTARGKTDTAVGPTGREQA